MPMEFTEEQEKAVRWKFEIENAEWIENIRNPKGAHKENHASATISSRFTAYKEHVWQDKGLLEKIEAEYNEEKNAAVAFATRDIVKNIDVSSYSKMKSHALKWDFQERYTDELSSLQSKETGGQAKLKSQELYKHYEQNMLNNASELFTIIDRYQAEPKVTVEAGINSEKLVTQQKVMG